MCHVYDHIFKEIKLSYLTLKNVGKVSEIKDLVQPTQFLGIKLKLLNDKARRFRKTKLIENF